ncbi:transposase, partial [Mesorhizobium sp.]|uniref:IS66 family transposase n=1 Tax=Mesorhizobium sp. TaxID=1871066 RepID=UPI0025DDCF36
MAAKGVDIERSTLARSAGYAAALLDPIYNRIREIGRSRSKIHTDDTKTSPWSSPPSANSTTLPT